MNAVALDGRRPDLRTAADQRQNPGQPFAVRRKRLRTHSRLDLRQSLKLAGAVRAGPVNARSCRIRREEDDVRAIRSPYGRFIRAGQESDTRRGFALEILYPDVLMSLIVVHGKRQASTVGRKPRGTVESRSRMQRLLLTCAVQPENGLLRLHLPSEA